MNGEASVRLRFSRAAATYAGGAFLHESVASALMECLPWPEPAVVMSIFEGGCGTGVLTARLRKEFPAARITAIDAAEGMARLTASRMKADPAVAIACGDVRTFVSAEPYDLAASSSALHWMAPPAAAFERMAQLVRPGGWLRVALMVEGTLGELHATRRRLFPDLAPVTRLASANVVAAACAEGGWRISRRVERDFRFQYRSADEFLRTLHAQGVTGGGVSHGRRLLTRGELAQLRDAYGREWGDGAGGVIATYSVLFLAGGK